jgi:pyruvate dehydrogenase E1 component
MLRAWRSSASLGGKHVGALSAARANSSMTNYKDFMKTYTPPPKDELVALAALEQKAIWLSTYMIHNVSCASEQSCPDPTVLFRALQANNLREKRDGLKVGGHQASSTSLATMLTALYFKQMLPQDRTAVKPHASPLFHGLQYLAGRQSVEQLQRFRAFGGIQSYPSRTKDKVDIDFSTGSVGLGAAVTTFAALIQDYLVGKGLTPNAALAGGDGRLGKMIALVGDAELDEGNVYESLLESAKLGVRNNWWIVDYNRQSLDKVADDRGAYLIDKIFRASGWRVVTLKYGKKMTAAFSQEGGKHVKQWLNKVS